MPACLSLVSKVDRRRPASICCVTLHGEIGKNYHSLNMPKTTDKSSKTDWSVQSLQPSNMNIDVLQVHRGSSQTFIFSDGHGL